MNQEHNQKPLSSTIFNIGAVLALRSIILQKMFYKESPVQHL